MFLQVSVILLTGGHAWLGVCVVVGFMHGCGGECMVVRGHAWLWGVCVVAGGMHGCGGCVVAGGMCGCGGAYVVAGGGMCRT